MANTVSVRYGSKGAKQVTSEVDKLHAKLTNLQKQGAKGFAIGAGAAITSAGINLVTGALAGMGDLIGESIQAASDLNESLGKSEVVFGSGAKAIEKWADTSSTAFGLSKQAALEAAGTYGNLFQAFGVGQTEAAGMSKTLVELAADLASFNNTSVDDALVALRSGLSGETEPLKRYGIAISDARLRTELMAQGVTDLGATLTPLQKSTASYALIIKDSSLAQGDFTRTSEGLANQTRILAAEQENLKAKIGQEAIPLALEWDRAQLKVLETINAMADATKAETNTLGENVGAVETLIHTFGPLGDLYDDLIGDQLAAAVTTRENAEAMSDLGNFAGKTEDDLVGVTGATKDLGRASGKADDELGDLGDTMDDTRKKARDLEGQIGDLADTIVDELYGDTIRAGKEADLEGRIAELTKELLGTKKGTRAATELKGELAELRGQLFLLHLEQAEKEGPQAAIDFLIEERKKAGAAKGMIDKLIASYQTLANMQGRLGPIIRVQGSLYEGKMTSPNMLADGGHYSAGQPRIVGENGPELEIPSTSGTIVPNSALGGASIVIHNIDASGHSDPAAVGSAIESAMARVLRDQSSRGLIGVTP